MTKEKIIEAMAEAIALAEIDGWKLDGLYGSKKISIAQAQAALTVLCKELPEHIIFPRMRPPVLGVDMEERHEMEQLALHIVLKKLKSWGEDD